MEVGESLRGDIAGYGMIVLWDGVREKTRRKGGARGERQVRDKIFHPLGSVAL